MIARDKIGTVKGGTSLLQFAKTFVLTVRKIQCLNEWPKCRILDLPSYLLCAMKACLKASDKSISVGYSWQF